MPIVTLSSKHQITLPVEIVRTMGLKPGDKIVAELIDDHVVLVPKPESWVDYFKGSLRGVYGSTVEEIDRYIAEERRSWDRDEPMEQIDNLLASDPAARLVVKILLQRRDQWYACFHNDLLNQWKERMKKETRDWQGDVDFRKVVQKLIDHGAVRVIPHLPGEANEEVRYRLKIELAKRYESLP